MLIRVDTALLCKVTIGNYTYSSANIVTTG